MTAIVSVARSCSGGSVCVFASGLAVYRAVFCFSALLALSGCQTAVPEPESQLEARPPSGYGVVAEAVTGAGDYSASAVGSSAPAVTEFVEEPEAWIIAFGDERLTAYVREALANNNDLQAAADRVMAAYYGVKLAGADGLPQVGVGTGLTRSARGSGTGGSLPGVSLNQAKPDDSWDFSLALSWELDVWGRIRAGKQAAASNYAATAAEAAAFRQSLQGRVAQAYFTVVAAGEQLSLAEQTARSFADNAAVIEGRYERGLAQALDLRFARANAASAEAAVQGRKADYASARYELELLLGQYPQAGSVTAGTLQGVSETVPVGIPAQLLEQRWDIRAAGQRLLGAEYSALEARRSMLPQFSLSAGGGYSADELEQFFESPFRVWNLAGNLSQPLFQGGRLRANAERQAALRDAAVAEYQQAVIRAFKEVENALANEQFLSAREQALAAGQVESQAAEGIAQQRYQSGLVDIVTLLEAQRRAFTAGSDLINARLARLQNRVALHLALGGDYRASDGLLVDGAESHE